MTPEAIVAMVTAIATASGKWAEFLTTPAGQQAIEDALKDKQAFAEGAKKFGQGVVDFFQGKFFEGQP